MQSEARPSRRMLQFSLRTLMLGVLLVAVFFGGRASVYHLIEAAQKRADKAGREARKADALRNRAIAQQRVVEFERDVERLEWQQDRRKLELDRIQDAKERHEVERRLQAAGIKSPSPATPR